MKINFINGAVLYVEYNSFVYIFLDNMLLCLHPLPHLKNMLSILFTLFLSLCGASPTINYLNIIKNVDSTLAFNIKINGVNYFSTNQIVSDNGYKVFPFERNYNDTVAIIIMDYSNYPGKFFIENSFNQKIYDSTSYEFHIVNQCSSEASCYLKVESFGNWDEYVVPLKILTNEKKSWLILEMKLSV